MSLRRLAGAALMATALLGPMASSAQGERGLTLGLTDPVFEDGDASVRADWLDRAVDSRAGLVLLEAGWREIAPDPRPVLFNPADPGDLAYNWTALDDAVRDSAARGLTIVMLVNRAPDWAEGPDRPATADAGTWRPDPTELNAFAKALASRYSGSYAPDPAFPGDPLPAVRLWQLWAEPNLSVHLTPQWNGRSAASPSQYRAMLNSFYAGIKSISSASRIVTAGTAPYGDGPGGPRMPPVRFWRELLCLKGAKLHPSPCAHPAHFDIFAHNPINQSQPRRGARSSDDATTPDLGRIKRVVAKALESGRALPKRNKPMWATEFWWPSNPPDPGARSSATQARWLEEALYLLWRQGASVAVWFQIRDPAPIPDYRSTFQTGLFLRDGTPKLAYQAFRFPLVSERTSKRLVRVWGKAPRPGSISIQRAKHGVWHTLKRVNVGGSRVFLSSVKMRGSGSLRALSSTESSLPWAQH
ncbi:MAG: hypothetical protein QOJ38_702 [Solirubrobacterales bacterium]|jgi:hypothetical protein|nr:hypothetical protein [Solirubrobacterales bacterium]